MKISSRFLFSFAAFLRLQSISNEAEKHFTNLLCSIFVRFFITIADEKGSRFLFSSQLPRWGNRFAEISFRDGKVLISKQDVLQWLLPSEGRRNIKLKSVSLSKIQARAVDAKKRDYYERNFVVFHMISVFIPPDPSSNTNTWY